MFNNHLSKFCFCLYTIHFTLAFVGIWREPIGALEAHTPMGPWLSHHHEHQDLARQGMSVTTRRTGVNKISPFIEFRRIWLPVSAADADAMMRVRVSFPPSQPFAANTKQKVSSRQQCDPGPGRSKMGTPALA